METVGTENELFEQWRREKTPELERALIRTLRRHGYAVVWEKLRGFHPDIVNWGVYKALQGAEKFRGDAKFSTWFHRIMTNLCLKHVRTKARTPEIALLETHDSAGAVTGDAGLMLGEFKRGLKDGEIALLELQVAGHTQTEIAEILGKTQDSVKMEWMRVKQKIRRRNADRQVSRTVRSGGCN